MDTIAFKSYSWAIGTTSFRTKDFNLNIEKQLGLLKEFWETDNHAQESWSGNSDLQKEYYYFLQENNFVKGDAPRPEKDARQKTSGMVDIGLLSKDRKLTEAGLALLDISNSGDFESDNILGINRDSYIFLKQLLKTNSKIEDDVVRPFVVFLYLINQLGSLSYEEFTFLLPLCISSETTEAIIEDIIAIRNNTETCDNVIIKTLLRMPNYRAALEMLLSGPVNEELICNIGINRKSRSYDKPYYELYKALEKIVLHDSNDVFSLYKAIDKVKIGKYWRQYLFSTNSRSRMQREGRACLNETEILRLSTEEEFKTEFFKLMHLFKAKANLSDFFDLNRRFFKATDIVIFEDSKVRLDTVPRVYFQTLTDCLKREAFVLNGNLEKNIDLIEISEELVVPEEQIYQALSKEYGVEIRTTNEANRFIRDERYRRFNSLIDEKFSIPVLIDLFNKFENRNDEAIREIVTNNADVPTIFEYILAIAWYLISDREGDVLQYMNLSLEADLLPKTHAAGGDADIVWKYDKTDFYPEHTLLIEATLSDRTNQRRMEMEPVSRHLGDYMLTHPEDESYCVFVATNLHPNVISDFRQRKDAYYYNMDGDEYVHGLKIIGFATKEIKTILRSGAKYNRIYAMSERAYLSDKPAMEWYQSIVHEVDSFSEYGAETGTI